MKIENGRRVRLKVQLKAVGGDIIEKSVVEYIHGGGTMLPGLERVLDSMESGTKKEGVIQAANAFGDPSFQREKRMSRKEFPKDAKLKVGDRFVAKGVDNQQNVVLEISKVGSDEVRVQLRHPLADNDIEYKVHVLQVTDPRPPPLPPEALGARADD
ncbi:FKBP-type peptidyl-prolyl cis-trans isomerase [Haliangium ochraceum]|uniref:peptidylprolyl isomerase n=1 Tax=Haliangium ochraceum (strain DSM 14365 / JCM 11303 / SMP-2) TaxID=502025 RepID=D0LKB0_HALO1|nr:FKBP-type peptidyl-prolyl cis-trans isomerase [Haliangium ochraceum]ACY13144.1 FKBP-type peptidyl-prolyl cis-trans isomerase 2- like protein [Haliangium ochraceum DSM 14365]